MAVPRITMSNRIRDAGGHYNRHAKVWVLPALAGFPEALFDKIEDAFVQAVHRRTVAQRESPVGPIYAHRYHY